MRKDTALQLEHFLDRGKGNNLLLGTIMECTKYGIISLGVYQNNDFHVSIRVN